MMRKISLVVIMLAAFALSVSAQENTPKILVGIM